VFFFGLKFLTDNPLMTVEIKIIWSVIIEKKSNEISKVPEPRS